MVKMLLKFEKSLLSLEVENGSRNTSIHLIVLSGNTSLLKLVNEFEPDLTVKNVNGDTPLHTAVLKNDSNMCRLLQQIGGADLLLAKNNAGLKPVDLTTDQRLKLELQAPSRAALGSVVSSLPKHVPERSKTPTYSMAIGSVKKGEDLTKLIYELQG